MIPRPGRALKPDRDRAPSVRVTHEALTPDRSPPSNPMSSPVPSRPLRLLNARLPDRTNPTTIALRDGSIARLTPTGSSSSSLDRSDEPKDERLSAPRTVDLDGALVLPAPVDSHVHLDKTFFGGSWPSHDATGDTVGDRVAHEKRMRRAAERPVRERAEALLQHLLRQGTTAIRTHADVDDDVGLKHVRALIDLREAYAGRVDLEIVAFPQSGVVRCPDAAELLDAAMAAGADLVGGLDPRAFDGDADGQLDVVFDVASRHDAGIDIHLHETGREGDATLRDLAARTDAAGMGGRVTASHAFSLGDPAVRDRFDRTADRLAQAGVQVVTSVPGVSPVPPVKRLRAAGVTVAAGSDNIRDAWSPLGTGDMIERAFLLARRQGYRRDGEFDLAYDVCSSHGADVLGLPERGLEPGDRADLIAVDADTVGDALARRPERLCIVRDGSVVRAPDS